MRYLLLLFIVCGIFSFYEAYHFIRFDGKMKRGIKIGSGFLSAETMHFLRNLKSSIVQKDTNAFIRKEDQLVLIQPISNLFQRNLGFWYIGLVDLSVRLPRITYYTPIFGLLLIVVFTSMLVYPFLAWDAEKPASGICAFIFVPLFYGIAHPFSKKVVLKYIEKSRQIKSG